MKTRLPRLEFVDALTAITAVTSSRTPKPILGCVQLATEGEAVQMAATDGEVSARLVVSAFKVEKRGAVVVPAERLLQIVREMPDAEVRLEADDRHCVIKGGRSEYRIFVHPAADFPAVPTFEEESDLAVDGHRLHRMVGLTLYAAARETSRYAINGVLWEKQGKRLYLVATDGRRLARAGGPLAEARSADFKVIVPSKALSAFERVFAPGREAEDWVIGAKVTPNQLILRSGERMLSTALVEGTFPKYEEVVPAEATRRAKLNRLEFYGAVRRAALLTTDEARAVKLAFTKDLLVITSNSPEQGDARDEMAIEFEGEPLEIGFNPSFLGDALKALTHEEVRMELTEGFRPGVLLGGDRDEFLYVVMPVAT